MMDFPKLQCARTRWASPMTDSASIGSQKEAGKHDGRLWWSVKVNGREGMDTMELALIADGFVFQTTGGFKVRQRPAQALSMRLRVGRPDTERGRQDVAVYKGELMQLERKQTQSLLQTPAEFVSINR